MFEEGSLGSACMALRKHIVMYPMVLPDLLGTHVASSTYLNAIYVRAMKQNVEKDYRKPCTICSTPRDVLVRCQIDETNKWHFVCPGKCWKEVSGGVIDGDKSEEHQYYRYGGMWKNKHEAVSAKKPKGLGLPKGPEDVEPHRDDKRDVENASPM